MDTYSHHDQLVHTHVFFHIRHSIGEKFVICVKELKDTFLICHEEHFPHVLTFWNSCHLPHFSINSWVSLDSAVKCASWRQGKDISEPWTSLNLIRESFSHTNLPRQIFTEAQITPLQVWPLELLFLGTFSESSSHCLLETANSCKSLKIRFPINCLTYIPIALSFPCCTNHHLRPENPTPLLILCSIAVHCRTRMNNLKSS